MMLKVLGKSFLWTMGGFGFVAFLLFIASHIILPFFQWLADDMLRALVALFITVFLIVTVNTFYLEAKDQ